MPQAELIEPPEWFSELLRVRWKFAIDHAPRGLLKSLDRDALAIWVVASDFHQRATEAQLAIDAGKSAPFITRTKDGNVIQSPYLPIINKQASIMLKAAAELGFTPSSRSRVAIDREAQEEDATAKYFTGA